MTSPTIRNNRHAQLVSFCSLRMQKVVPVVFTTMLMLLANGDDTIKEDKPRYAQAIQAKTKYDIASRKAREVHQAATKLAGNQYTADLQKALTTAARNGDADEILRIKEEIDRVNVEIDLVNREAELGKSSGNQAPRKRFMISADKDWQPTIEVKKGDKIEVEATGKWCGNIKVPDMYGPDGREGRMYLEGRIGEGIASNFGSRKEFVSDQDGVLSFRCHDGARNDNGGSLIVKIIKL